MAARVIAPVSVTTGADGQKLDTFEQWNAQDWFDNARWGLTGDIQDSNYKSGLWWQDAQDMNSMVPALLKHADGWTGGRGQLVAAQQKLRSVRADLASNQGENAQALQTAMDQFDKALQARMDAVQGIPGALQQAAQTISDNYPKMQQLWDKWEQDRANAPVCHADVQQMQPIISAMAQGMLDASNAMIQGYHTELETPTVSQAPPSHQPTTQQPVSTVAPVTPAPTAPTSPAAPTIVPAVHHVPTHTPSHVTAPAGTLLAGTRADTTPALAGTGAGTLAPVAHVTSVVVHATPATHVPMTGGVTPPVGSGPLLAGSATLAPPPVAGSAGPITAGSAGLQTTGGPAAGGALPGGFAAPIGGGVGIGASRGGVGIGASPGRGLTAPFGTAAGMAPAAGRSSRDRDRDRESRRDDRRAGIVPPGMMAGGAQNGRAGATIRPGVAKSAGSVEGAGVSSTLRGRSAEGDDGVIAASTRRRSTRRARDDRAEETVRFLDEEAWQTDDAGSGVVAAAEPTDHVRGPVATPTVR